MTTDQIDPPVHMDGVSYSQVALVPPFRFMPGVADEWRLYVIRADNVVLGVRDVPIPLARGTVIGMSGAIQHAFESVGTADLVEQTWQEAPLGTATAADDAVIAIGRIAQSSLPFLSMMGAFVRIDPFAEPGATARIGGLIDWIGDETRRHDRATPAIVLRLAEIITIEMGRVGRAQSVMFREQPSDAEYDPRIWRAIAAVFGDPQRNWSVQDMAHAAGMSRSAFAVRYHQTIGMTPLRSLRRLRMHRAATSLASPGAPPLTLLAALTGYGSEAAFCRAFAREFGSPPGEYGRRERRRGHPGDAP